MVWNVCFCDRFSEGNYNSTISINRSSSNTHFDDSLWDLCKHFDLSQISVPEMSVCSETFTSKAPILDQTVFFRFKHFLVEEEACFDLKVLSGGWSRYLLTSASPPTTRVTLGTCETSFTFTAVALISAGLLIGPPLFLYLFSSHKLKETHFPVWKYCIFSISWNISPLD